MSEEITLIDEENEKAAGLKTAAEEEQEDAGFGFLELGLSGGVLRALEAAGLNTPTEIQARAIPAVMEGRDVIGRSHTGTGKTMAFGIPAVEYCLANAEVRATQVLVLCPTRELAMQVCDEIRRLTRFVDSVRTVCVYGGQPIQNQIPHLRRGAEIVIGTPGRVMDHIHRKTLRLENLGMVVLDEADEMLDMGFREDIESILAFVPGEHQTLLFSATMPQAILDITQQYQNDPVLIETSGGEARTIDTVKQYYYKVPMGQKSDALGLLLHTHSPKLCMIFCNTKKTVEELNRYLGEHGFHCSCLHGDIKQEARTAVMQAFKTGRTPILIATDVAARGIDVDDVDAVYNYDIPQDYEYYIHRIGRTGRAGREGVSYTLAAGRRQEGQLRDISRFTGAKIELLPLPNTSDLVRRKQDELAAEIRENLPKEIPESINASVRELLQETSPEHLAETLFSLLIRREMSDVPELIIPQEGGKQRGGSPLPPVPEGYVRLRFGVGRYQRVAPNHIVAAIADATRIPGKAIQKIYCYGEYSLVEVPSKFKSLIIKKVNGTEIGGHRTDVRLYTDTDSRRPNGTPSGKREANAGGRFARPVVRRKKDDEHGGEARRRRTPDEGFESSRPSDDRKRASRAPESRKRSFRRDEGRKQSGAPDKRRRSGHAPQRKENRKRRTSH